MLLWNNMTVNMLFVVKQVTYPEVWCNGSTTDFGSVSPGSNPSTSTNTVTIVFYVLCE